MARRGNGPTKVYPAGEDGAPGRRSGNSSAPLPPPGEDTVTAGNETWDARSSRHPRDELENQAQSYAEEGDEPQPEHEVEDYDTTIPTDKEFLQIVTEATSQGKFYSNQVNKRAWERAYMAFRQQHFTGSKYTTNEFKNRSRLFVPKTRAAIRKDVAAVAASMFGSKETVSIEAGNSDDMQQKGGAAVVQEIVDYRTDSANGESATPWFLTALGARQTSLLTGFCVSKQYWKLDLRKAGQEEYQDEDGRTRKRDVWKPYRDRPEIMLLPPENCTIDPACDWTNPAQDSAYFIIRYPMRIDEILRMQKDPLRPWRKGVTADQLRACGEGSRMEASAIRRARDQGLDRYDEEVTGPRPELDVIWVSETFVRTAGDDWTFISAGDMYLLTDPAPVSEVYPEQHGERPIRMGYGNFEAFCVFPMSAVESWQMLQQEANDVRNLTLDAFKQNVMPVTKVVRGKQVDLEQLRRRGQGTAIMVQNRDDVTWERPPEIPQAAQLIKQQIDIEFDDLAGQQNYGSVATNNALGETLGGLKLAAGAANAVQELDMRVWTTTWAEPVMRQFVNLIQYYESDQIIIGRCGESAKLFQKFGIDEITDEMLEHDVTTRVSIGYGSGDPQQRLAKFTMGYQAAMPLLQMDPDFKSGKKVVDGEAVMAETFGAVGFRDGGKRFIKDGPPQQQDPMQQPEIAEKMAGAELKKSQAKAAILNALSNAAKVGIQLQDAELQKAIEMFSLHVQHADQIGRAHDMGHQHGKDIADRQRSAQGLNPDGTPMLPPPGETGEGGNDGSQAAPAQQDQGAPSPDQPPSPDQAVTGAEPVPANSPKPAARKRNVRITGRGTDGRANAFEIEDA
jgi:hypothetical protein